MLKRTTARLLLFGIPFTISYLVNRPPAPSVPDMSKTYQVPMQNRDFVIAVDRFGRIILQEIPHASNTSVNR